MARKEKKAEMLQGKTTKLQLIIAGVWDSFVLPRDSLCPLTQNSFPEKNRFPC
jgi:hypothetical protein